MKDIIIYGAGGFGREVYCLIERINRETGPRWNILGFLDDGYEKGQSNEYGVVLGNMDTLNSWEKTVSVVFAIGNPKVIEALTDKIKNPNVDFPNIISPDTIFLDKNNVRMGYGNIICSRSLISCNVEIGNFNILNGYVKVGHDSTMGSFNSVMPSVNISGGVRIGDRNFLGVNSVVLQYKSIGNDTTVGASSVVIRNTKDGHTYVGNPARKIEY